MCHDSPMANHRLNLMEGRLMYVTLLTVGSDRLREALVNFDVSPYQGASTDLDGTAAICLVIIHLPEVSGATNELTLELM